MKKILHIEVSPRKARSASIQVAKAYLQSYQTKNPNDLVETLDLWAVPLPEFDETAINAKFKSNAGIALDAAEQAAWSPIVAIAEHFKKADAYVFSVPMWNFGIPYKLKHYFDLLAQGGLTFRMTPEGQYQGLVVGKKATVIYSRGGSYPAGTPYEAYDHQKAYVEAFLRFLGFTEIETILVENTATDKGSAVKVIEGIAV